MMKNLICWILLAAILVHKGFSVTNVTEAPDEDDDDWDDEDDSSEADDDGRVYKNPRNSPSTECPRDEEQATLLKQKCLRKCSSDEDCKSKKKKCLCAGACGMSCIKPDRECPELDKPELGEVSYSGRLFGSRATYTCPHGYHVVGLQSRLCLADGTWAGAEPACKQNIYCLTPPTIEHARHSALPEQATFDLDATVQYNCHIGYVTNGFPRAKCLAIDGQASWYGPDISCEPQSCGQPPDPLNGFHSGECYTFGCLIRYHCSEGYELVGKAERLCDSNGSWTPQLVPNCVLVTSVQCPPPENPKNGRAIYTSFSYNSISSYECKYGFTLVGDSSRRCGADKKWSGTLPICKEINCEHPGVLYNGWLEGIDTGTGLGASIIFRCQPGMLLKGHSSTVCQIDGRWRYSVPLCLAPCVVPTISQGIVIPNENEYDFNGTTLATPGLGSISKVQHGTMLEVMCEEHYEFPLSSLSPPICNNGTWSVIPRCVPARCKSMPKPPKNGMVLAPKTEHGMKARFKCKDGFNLTGPGGKEVTDPNEYVLTCSFGNWTGITPACQEVYCSFPGYISNGKVLLVGNMGLYDYRPYVRKIINNKQIMYDCDKGYVLSEGPVGATCIGGLWRPTELPSCLLGQHPRLRWNRKRRSASMSAKYKRYHIWVKDHLNRLAREDIERSKNQRSKRNIESRVVYPLTYYRNIDNHTSLPVFSISHTREKRQLSDIERAYSKYYQKIKEKYKNYVKHLLGYTTTKHANNSLPHRGRLPSKDRIQVQDGRWLNTYNNPEMWSRYRATHKTRTGVHEDITQDDTAKITIPDINDNRDSSEELKMKVNELLNQEPEYRPPNKLRKYDQEALKNYRQKLEEIASMESQQVVKNSTDSNLPSIIAQLKSQIVRKKRAIHDARTNYTTDKVLNDENGNDTVSGNRKNRLRIPCEPLMAEIFSSIETVRPGKNETVEYSSGTIVKLTCLRGQLNFQNPNSTAKCVKGRWKPVIPTCVTRPCTIPTADVGNYFAVDPKSPKEITGSLKPLDDVENGLRVIFRCPLGFNIQGSHSLACNDGEWDAPAFPECMASPCILPLIPNAAYLSGYRAELTIANGSSVSVQCENSPASSIVQMECILGQLNPSTVNCQTGSRKSREDFSGTNVLEKSEEESEEGSEEETSSEEDLKNACGPPTKIEAALVYKNSEELDNTRVIYPAGTEITFNCIASVPGERSTWKIICEDGVWIGRALNCLNTSCMFHNNEPNVVSFYNDLEIREETVEFPPGATIVSRCVDIGKFMMMGSNIRSCIHSEWNAMKPICYGLNQENDYAMEKSPTILFRHQNGPIAQSNDGKLIVHPGTTLHMECLWMRRFGNPKWNVSHEFRKYPEGWVTDENRDPQLEYRLSIFNAVEDDSGIYSCQTPARHEHAVEVVVKAINCPEIPARRGLIMSTTDTKLSTKVVFSCANGNSLIGASEITCLPSSNWSAPLPVCESVECGDIPLLTSSNGTVPRVAVLSREVGGRAAFSCPSGYGLRGSSESVCLPSGEWAQPFPSCVEVQCDNPGAPQNGYAQGSAPYRAGDVVQFNCNPEYMMQGQPIIACQDNGRWSGGLPKCVQACSYPGTAISGRMSSVKFYYAIGESITFTCDSGLLLRGAKMLKCLRNGKWSNAIPTCVSADASEDILDRQTSKSGRHSKSNN